MPGVPLAAEPQAVVERNGVRFTLLGTAHVSRTSADEVRRLIREGAFDAIAIELDRSRYQAITDPDRLAKMDLFQVLREGKAGMVAANLALGAFQQRLAEQFGIEPGQEMRAAIQAAEEAQLPLLLIDRDIGVTLRRTYRNVRWWQRLTLVGGLLTSLFSSEEITEEEIERLKQGDMLEATFSEFAARSNRLYEPLIHERDAYMAACLEKETLTESVPYRDVLVVIGAGHLKGLQTILADPPETPPQNRLADLEHVPPPSMLPRLLPWLLVAIILSGFVIGFLRSPDLGLRLLSDWVLINGTLAGLGALVALAHPLTIAGSFIAAPLTSLNPLIGAGIVAAALELWLRKPHVGDFASLRKDVTRLGGWWRNRVARTLVVFFLVTLGSAAGTYLAGFRIFGRLFS